MITVHDNTKMNDASRLSHEILLDLTMPFGVSNVVIVVDDDVVGTIFISSAAAAEADADATAENLNDDDDVVGHGIRFEM